MESAPLLDGKLVKTKERASARGLALVSAKVWEAVSEMGSVQMMGKASEMARAQTWETVSETSLARVWVKASVQVSEPRSETASAMVWEPVNPIQATVKLPAMKAHGFTTQFEDPSLL